VHEDTERCVGAVMSKDARFDGWFVTAVTSTHIYCRPSCPARPPHVRHMRFYPTAAAAQQGGFRACKRCRPDASPGSPEWNVRQDLTARAMRLIADGTVERDGVGGLSSRLGYSERQLERLLVAEVGAGPLALARAQRAQTARLLIETTSLAFADVAFGAGFGSVRQFNDTVRLVFAVTPTELRRRARSAGEAVPPGTLSFRLAYRQPFDPTSLFGHLAATSIPGVEEVRDGHYRRTLDLPGGPAIAALAPVAGHVACQLTLADLRDLQTAISRCRRLLDLDADPVAARDLLARDRHLARLVKSVPGRRLPGCVDGAEMAVRVVLGQQVSTLAARTHGRRLVEDLGQPLVDAHGGLDRTFPTMASIAEAPASTLRFPAARQRCLRAVATALADGDIDLSPGADVDAARAALGALPGIGPWSVEMIALRGLADPDALPLGDLGVRRGADILGLPASPRSLAEHATTWRPWRSYATQYLWAADDHPINHWPPKGRT
jgi:AraC family transcriptional regulator of adaptative response / DNA-3-methyladenine glycosylase II